MKNQIFQIALIKDLMWLLGSAFAAPQEEQGERVK